MHWVLGKAVLGCLTTSKQKKTWWLYCPYVKTTLCPKFAAAKSHKIFLGYRPDSDLRYRNVNPGWVNCTQRRHFTYKLAKGRTEPGSCAGREQTSAFVFLCLIEMFSKGDTKMWRSNQDREIWMSQKFCKTRFINSWQQKENKLILHILRLANTLLKISSVYLLSRNRERNVRSYSVILHEKIWYSYQD